MIVKAEEQHLNIVRKITQQTIDEIYQHYYPIGAVVFLNYIIMTKIFLLILIME